MAVYTNDLRLTELATGEGSGTWGNTTNTNLELIAEAFSFGTEAITTNADTHTTTIADGSTDAGRSLFLKYTGTLDSACTITIGPNTVSKLWLIQNSTSGGFSIIIKQGSGATVTVPNGQTKAIYSDGAGSGGAMVDAFAHLNVVDLTVEDDLTITDDLTVNGDIDLEGSIDVNGTTNLDVVDIDGALTQDGGAVFNEASADVDFRIESNGQENMFFVDGGDDAVVIGNNSSRKTLFNTTATAAFQIEGTSGNTAAMSIARNSNDDNGPQFVLAKSNGTSAGAVTVVTDDALLGRISFQGADGTQTVEGARVEAFVSGTPGANDMPGRLVFSTTQDGSATPTERWRIDSVGNLTSGGNAANGIGATPSDANFAELGAGYLNLNRDDTADASQIQFGKNGIAHSHIQTSASGLLVGSLGNMNTFVNAGTSGSNVLDLQTGGTTRMRVSNQEVIVNEDGSSGIDFRVESDNNANMLFVDAGSDHVNIGTATDYDAVLNVLSTGNDKTLSLVSTDTDANAGPILALTRQSSSSAADNDYIGEIKFEGLNDANEQIAYAGIAGRIVDASDGTEDGRFEMYTELAGAQISRVLSDGTETVINQDSANLDFRVESNSNANMFIVDAGNDRVQIANLLLGEISSNVDIIQSTSSDGLLIDVTGELILDADTQGSGNGVLLKDGGTHYGSFFRSSSDFHIKAEAQDEDMIFMGNDGGTEITALTLDMSAAGRAIFGADADMADGQAFRFGDSQDFLIYHSSNENIIQANTTDQDIIFKGVDGGSSITPITIDMSAGGKTTITNSTAGATNLQLNNTGSGAGSELTFFKVNTAENVVGKLKFNTNDSTNTETNIAEVVGFLLDVTDGTEDGQLAINAKLNGTNRERLKVNDTEAVFNEEGQDLDFRVESDTNSHMLFVDAGNNNVAVGHSSAGGATFAISDSGNATIQFFPEISTDTNLIQHYDLTAAAYMNAETRAASHSFKIGTAEKVSINSAGATTFSGNVLCSDILASGSGGLSFQTDEGTKRLTIFDSGDVVINDVSAAVNFRVESDDETHALFVDGANDAVCIGKSSDSITEPGSAFSNLQANGHHYLGICNTESTSSNSTMYINRQDSDGDLIVFRQANTTEGTIAVSGSTVSYNGFAGRHESSGIATNTAVGTVVSTIDELDVYPDTQPDINGSEIPNPKAGQTRADHAKVKVSDAVGDARVYGVVAEFTAQGKAIVTSVGIGSIKVTGACAGGDLLESNGDGTAKVQSDDIIRSSTIGKVTIGNSDTGVKLVSCVLYCG